MSAAERGAVELRIRERLAAVHDPEIPPVSITDLGMVEAVKVHGDRVEVDLLPTFAGCPALDVIRDEVHRATEEQAGGREVSVRFLYHPPWTSDRITPQGREALRSHGLTPPPALRGPDGAAPAAFVPVASLHRSEGGVTCPYCGGTDTVVESAFGPTLCRSTHFCRSCRNPFEAFKPKGE